MQHVYNLMPGLFDLPGLRALAALHDKASRCGSRLMRHGYGKTHWAAARGVLAIVGMVAFMAAVAYFVGEDGPTILEIRSQR